MEKVAITIPIYKTAPSPDEIASLRQCGKVLGVHPIIFFAPESLDATLYCNLIPTAQVTRFSDKYFSGISGYNQLMLSTQFYERFFNYEFILIYQPDAWVFRDELDYWCRQHYDYIGAPIFMIWGGAEKRNTETIIGNGGLSLRRVASLHRVLNNISHGHFFRPRRLLEFFGHHWKNHRYIRALIPLARLLGCGNSRRTVLRRLCDGHCNEDVVFHELSKENSFDGITMASYSDAIRFSFDSNPEKLFSENNCEIPFGCHAWKKFEYDSFWKTYIAFEDKI